VSQALRNRAIDVFCAGVTAADPFASTAAALGELRPRAGPAGRVTVFAVGKAAFGMAAAASSGAGGDLRAFDVLLVVHDDAALVDDLSAPLSEARARRRDDCAAAEAFKALRSGHPLPDERGLAAAREIERRAAALGEGDLALVLISGGASALLPAPAPGIALEDKLETTRQLLRAGATIHELNAVRKHLSTTKGGGLLRQLRPARVVTLALSDVIDDDPSVIGSGPTAPDPSTFKDAFAVLEHRGVLATCPPPVRARLEAGIRGELEETPKPDDPVFNETVYRTVGGNRTSVQAMAAACGKGVEVEPAPLEGEACEVGAMLAGRFACAAPRAWVAGGETTVTVRGVGNGGRNQELALAFALEAARGPLADRRDWVFLAAGTDGRDGPTDAAGGVVDASTVGRIRSAGVDPVAGLDDNDSYHALDAGGALLRTGATGTNVADVAVFLTG
jgi:hydroxypyruvate reductase